MRHTAIRAALFVRHLKAADRRRNIDAELQRCTDEQIRVLDCCAQAERIVVNGPAGAGKTAIAIAVADREVARAALDQARARILLVCYNRMLARRLQEQMAPLNANVRVGTLHRVMMDVAGFREAPTNSTHHFWDTELPQLAADRLLGAAGPKWTFDMLIVDEAQDLMAPRYRDVLDLLVRGGLRGGRWRMFGDFARQSIYQTDPLEVAAVLRGLRAGSTPLNLRDNCRNTPLVAGLATSLGGLTPPYSRVLRKDDGLSYELSFYETETQQRAQLLKTVGRLLTGGYSEREITVLSACRDSRSVAATTSASGQLFVPAERASAVGVPYASIHSFKGMENRAIVLTDITEVESQAAQDLFYVGITRSQGALSVLCHESAREELQRCIMKPLQSGTRGSK